MTVTERMKGYGGYLDQSFWQAVALLIIIQADCTNTS